MLNIKMKQHITDLCKKNTPESDHEIRQILIEHIKVNPNDIDMHLKLIKHNYSTAPFDICDTIDYINDLLSYDSTNIHALLILAYIQRYEIAIMDVFLINQLKEYQTDNKEIMAMIALAVSWFYELEKNVSEQEKWLKKSLEFCNKFVQPYYELILLYFYQGNSDLARSLIPFALNNITHIYNENLLQDKYLEDSTDVDEFFNSKYKGIHVMKKFAEDLVSWQKGESMPL